MYPVIGVAQRQTKIYRGFPESEPVPTAYNLLSFLCGNVASAGKSFPSAQVSPRPQLFIIHFSLFIKIPRLGHPAFNQVLCTPALESPCDRQTKIYHLTYGSGCQAEGQHFLSRHWRRPATRHWRRPVRPSYKTANSRRTFPTAVLNHVKT